MVTEPSIPVVDKGKGKAVDVPKKVTFATPDGQGSGTTTPTTKPEDPTTEKVPDPLVDGIIGQLELYRSGAVKMRLANGILLEVSLFRSLSHSRSGSEFIASFIRYRPRHNLLSFNKQSTSTSTKRNFACLGRSIDGSSSPRTSTLFLWTFRSKMNKEYLA